MILGIDIGNTSITFGVLKGLKVKKIFNILTILKPTELETQLKRLLKRIKKQYPAIKAVVICSVVPQALNLIEEETKKKFKVKTIVIGRDVKVPIKNNYHNPKQVGIDRLVGAYAVKKIYGFPAITIDFGTAITFDVVSYRGEYEGGMIVPGIRLSAESLFRKTALLPRIDKIEAPRRLIGKDTKESILSGIFYGYGAMSRGLIDLISKQMRGHPKIVVTGGYTHLMRKFIYKKIDKIDRDLVFKGIALIYKILPAA